MSLYEHIDSIREVWVPRMSTVGLCLILSAGIASMDFSAYTGTNPNHSGIVQPGADSTEEDVELPGVYQDIITDPEKSDAPDDTQ